MKFNPTPIDGVVVIEPTLFGDERGFFTRAFCNKTFSDNGTEFVPVQANHAASQHAGTLRGLHYQTGEHAEDKLMRCIKGTAFDVAVDMRPGSKTYLQWFGCELSAENKHMLLIPKGCAHGYLTLADDTEMYYLSSNDYAPDAEAGIRWDDPKLGIIWPATDQLVLSDKDQQWPLL